MGIRTGWKGFLIIALSVAVLGLATCGGPGGPSRSHLTHRAFVSDNLDGTIHILDAARDVESGLTISTGSQPGMMALSPDKSITLVFNSGSLTLSVVSNTSESVLGSPILLPAISTSYVSMSDDTVGFAAVPNCPVADCSGNSNVVEVVDLKTTFNVTGTVPIAHLARTLVLSPTGTKLLVLSGPTDHQNAMTVIDTATAKGSTPASAATQLTGADCTTASLPVNCFDRPVSAVFSSDGNTAYVFNCGRECGGTTAGVTVLNVSASAPALTKYVAFPATAGATLGLLSGSNLFVAGTPATTPAGFCPSASPCGTLSVLDPTALAAPATPKPISDGYHSQMALASSSKLFIAAINCTAGCLTIFDTSKNSGTVDTNTGDVTGIAPIGGRNVVYVVENVIAGSPECLGQLACLGELRIYDTTASTPTLTPTQIDIVGKAVDVKSVDQ